MNPFEISIFRPRRLSRDAAFAAQGVTLAYPGSIGGLRGCDGTVVVAIPEADVVTSAGGSRCLLWTPVIGARPTGMILHERLAHCRLALRLGLADGLLVARDGADVQRGQVLSLRVERRGADYWALWGSPAIAPGFSAPYGRPLVPAFGRLAA
jgi:hypothetical protein